MGRSDESSISPKKKDKMKFKKKHVQFAASTSEDQDQMNFKKKKHEKMEPTTHKKEGKIRTRVKIKDKTKPKQKKGKGRPWTVSVALPSSILENVQTPELRTYICGQIARALTIFNVDEVIIYDEYAAITDDIERKTGADINYLDSSQKLFCKMVRIFQYLECPQYLRKYLFPIHDELKDAGLLNPLDSQHHLRETDVCPYREGVVLDKKPQKKEEGKSLVYIGLNREAVINVALPPFTRVTVKLDDPNNAMETEDSEGSPIKAIAVSPQSPRLSFGLYWGYSVRIAKSISEVFVNCPFSKEGYDVTIGTSERGDSAYEKFRGQGFNFKHADFKHLLIVFGGVKGIESAFSADQKFKDISDPRNAFTYWLNTCPRQGSNTIRTEEAILISLSVLDQMLLNRRR